MKYLLAFFFLVLSSCVLNAQNLCKPTSVFFDLNKSALKPDGKSVVDSLIESVEVSEFILEIYGYTDTSNTDSYNRKLSQNRIDAVLSYLKKKKVVPKEIRTFNEGEDFTSSIQNKNAAFQRRVDLYITPMEGLEVVFKSPEGVIIKKSLASFGDCGVCALRPTIYYQQTTGFVNEKDVNLETYYGGRLKLSGIISFKMDSCLSVSKEEQDNIRMEVKSSGLNWGDQPGNDIRRAIPDKIYWDSVHKVLRLYETFRRRSCEIIGISDEHAPILVLPEESLKGRSFYIFGLSNSVQRLRNDTTLLKNTVTEVVSYFPVGTDWYLFKDKASKIEHWFLNRDSVSPNACLVYTSDYSKVSPKGELFLKVKLDGVEKVGYYNKEFDLLIELEHTSGNRYHGQIYQDGFELCYVRKGRYYLEKNGAEKLNVKTKDGVLKAKIKKKYLLKKNQLKWRNLKKRGLVN
ncbi:OmpA family protein [Fluviicola sp.]|uniref:OmpA family protein n=1 Tax=Fluviicola sp. TaxID=1917219 RepID=UPI0031D1D1E6